MDLGSDIRPYSLPSALDMHQELGGYVRAASWGPPSTTMPFTTLATFLPPTGDPSSLTETSRRPSLTDPSSLVRHADNPAVTSTLAVQDLLRQQQNVSCLPSELILNRFPLPNPSSTFSMDPNVDEIRQSLLSMPSLNSVFATSCNSPFTQFDQSVPSLPDSSHQLPFPPAATSSFQFRPFSTVPPPSFDPNFNAVTTTPLGQLPLATTCGDNFWQTSCLPFGDTNLYPYPGSRVAGDMSQAAAATNNNENVDDTRQDSSLWRPY